jgi:hypothetical protein
MSVCERAPVGSWSVEACVAVRRCDVVCKIARGRRSLQVNRFAGGVDGRALTSVHTYCL